MPSCVLRYCSNSSRNTNKNQGVTFHQFPGPCHENRESWIKFVQKNRSEETWLPSYYSRICSVHFRDDDKHTTKAGRVFLKKSAVPCENTAKCDEKEVSEPISESESSTNSIFDTPKIIVLKNQLRKESAAKKKLAERCKKIKRQNKYLRKKCAAYKTMAQNLKDKFVLNLNAGIDLMAKAESV